MTSSARRRHLLDEADQIPDLATQFFGAHVSSRQVESLLKELQAELGAQVAATVPAARSPVAALVLADAEEALMRLRAAAAGVPGRIAWSAGSLPVSDGVRALEESLLAVQATLAGADAQTALAALGERAAEIAARLARIGAVDELEGARTVESSPRGFTLSLMPFDISQRFRALLESRSAAWIFTSATLSLGADFGHFTAAWASPTRPPCRSRAPSTMSARACCTCLRDCPNRHPRVTSRPSSIRRSR